MEGIYECVCLLEENLSLATIISCILPEEYDVSKIQVYLEINAFPNVGLNKVFTFTIDDLFCHAILISFNEKKYSIILVTKAKYHKVFHYFMQNTIDCLDKYQSGMTPLCKMAYLNSIINTWYFEPDNTIHAIFYESERNIITEDMFFSPFDYLKPNSDIDPLWNTVLSGKKVLVVGEDASIVSRAALALTTLCRPFEYKENILICVSPADPRPVESNATITATTIPEESQLINKFSVMIKAKKERDASSEYADWEPRSNKFYDVIRHIIGHHISIDPFYEFKKGVFEEPWTHFLSKATAAVVPPPEVFEAFASTKTFKDWESSQLFRAEFRSELLSVDPSEYYSSMGAEEIIKMREILKKIIPECKNDEHLKQVIKRHLKFCGGFPQRSKSSEIIIENSESSNTLLSDNT